MASTIMSNMNSNNNHNSTQTGGVTNHVEEESFAAPQAHNHVLEETKEVVKRFLERSLSQNAKSSMTFMKPEGYHKLKKDGKLPFYQRQQSKPEPGNVENRPWADRRKSAGPTTSVRVTEGWSMRNSHSSLKTEQNNNFRSNLEPEEQQKYQSEMDVRTIQRVTESSTTTTFEGESSILLRLLGTATNHSVPSQSNDSTPDANDDDASMHTRRKSFNKAVTRESVISYIENKVKTSSEDVVPKTAGLPQIRRPSTTEHLESQPTGTSNSSHMQNSCLSEGGRSLPYLATEATNKDEERHRNKNITFRERMKKIMPNKKKIKYKKPTEAPKVEDSFIAEDGSRSDGSRSAGTRVIHSIDTEFNKATIERNSHSATASMSLLVGHESSKHHAQKHKDTSFAGRSSSPEKIKTPLSTPTLLKRAFSHKKSSPKTKRRPIHQSGSSSSLSFMTSPPTSGQLQRDKSGSLPSSVRYGIDQPLSSHAQRRTSEHLFPVKSSDKHNKSSPLPDHKHTFFHHHHDHHHEYHDHNAHHHDHRQHHHDYYDAKGKKPKLGKLRRFMRIFRKRHASESSNASSRSHSLPSIPNALDQDQAGQAFDHEPGSPKLNMFRTSIDKDEEERLPFPDDGRPYHHRGSLSFSSGDLDGLTAPEKKKVYDEIAETLSRLSSKYTSHIRSRSSTPGSRITTPDSSLTTVEFQQYSKASYSNPPSRQTSIKTPVHSPGKTFRKYERNEGSAALNAYYNLSSQRRTVGARSNWTEASMPSPPRPRIHHAKSGSLDSPRKEPRNGADIPKFQSSNPPPQDEDVVDGMLPTVVVATEEVVITEEETFLPDSLDAVDSVVSYSTVTVHEESEVDLPSPDSSSSTRDHRTRESRPSTSKADDDGYDEDAEENPYTSQIDEDKLVQLLVDALCKRGDEYAKSMDAPNGNGLAPFFRTCVIRYISGVTYASFQNFAQRFCTRCKQLVERSPTRHPEVFPFVMVFNMTELIINLASSERTTQAVNRIYEYTSQFITDLVEGSCNDWGTVLEQLQDTEAELSQEETTPRRDPTSDDELD